ncbi:DEKNAAC105383 [Brettanomyces naardenensis]|uniref:DEKNAAC105383 n=1 Tax=Brettanomyces naardenensis TaxID=13370 RepID=A0A448YTE2_BRENA|nr:DEKNAAC105383 [Brettanomyces naardenensis]
MDLLKILDAKPEPQVVDEDHFIIDPTYQLSNHYKIATPMSDFQKELMDQIVSLHYSDILKFFERIDDNNKVLTATQERIIMDSLQTMLTNAQLVASHPYLLIDHYFPKSLTNRDLPKRLAETSGKFQILSDILNVLDSIYNPRDRSDRSRHSRKSVNLGIVAKEGKTLDLIDSLCTGSRCYLKRYSGVKVRDSSSKQKENMKLHLTVHLFPSSMENLNKKELPKEDEGDVLQLDYLILFDITGDVNNKKLRKYMVSGLTKVIQLVPIYSVDHIALYFRHLVDDRNYNDYLKPVVAAIVVMRDRVGQLPPILKPVYTNHLQYLMEWFRDPIMTKWPLPDMPEIPTFNGKDVEHSLLTEVKFNFDNKDFLKEEAESHGEQPKELNLNFNFAGGKTQMVSHIVQPRFCGKDQNKLDFYEEKRWQKKYLTNPLNGDYYKLTGISREIHQNEVLTHTLIYSLNMKMASLEQVNMEVKTFDEVFESRMRSFRVMRLEYSKMAKDLEEMESRVKKKTSKIESMDKLVEELKGKINELKEGISKIVELEDSELGKKWIGLDTESVECREEISKLQEHIESNGNEVKYMKEEIERAEKSISESRASMEKKQEQVIELERKINELRDDHGGVEERKRRLEEVRERYDKAKNKNIELVDRLDLTFKRLVDASSGRGRYVNYGRGGRNAS